MAEAPVLIIGLTVCVYWFCVGAMVLRVRRQARGVRRVLIPSQWIERAMWVLWIPVVLGWMTIPFLAIGSTGAGNRWIGLPAALASSWLVHILRMGAALAGIVCLLLSMWCWQHMGREWRMGIDPTRQGRLLVNGPFAKVRHPIYALSMLLMLCSVAVLPAPAMALIAVVHIGLMLVKARNEERFLLQRHGQAYADYRARTGRFFPSLSLGYKVAAARPGNRGQTPASADRPPSAGPAFSRLNSFQEAMLLWEETHPYNAVHALRVSGPADVPALRRSIEQACRRAGLGALEIDPETRSYRYLEFKELPLDELPCSRAPEETLSQIINSGMNTRFPDSPSHPLRWSVFEEADRRAHHIVLAYRHIASDASGIEALLAGIMRQYAGREDPATDVSLRLSPSAGNSPADSKPGWGFRLAGIARGLNLYFRFRHMHKMSDESHMDDQTAVAVRSVPAAAFGRLSAACRARGYGLNDACLAALASVLAERTPHRRERRHRHKLALATIASTRKRNAVDRTGHFGVCLSDGIVVLNSPDAPIDDLLAQISAQTRRLKANPNPQTAASAMQGFLIRSIWPLLDIPNHRRSYRKLLPICGGVSTFVVDAERFGTTAPAITRYLRACPPGPALPIALAPTVFQGRLELSLVYRLSCLTPEKAEDLLDGLCAALSKLSGGPAAP